MANMGAQIGGMIQQYGLNKEKQKENKATIKSASGILERMKKLDPQNEPQYMMQIEELNNEDMGLGMRAKLADKALQGLSLTNQMQNQILNRDTQRQALGLAKKLEESQVKIAKLEAEIKGETKGSLVAGVEADKRSKEAKAEMLETDASYYKTDKALDRKDRQSLIDYRQVATLGNLLRLNNINAPVPQDLEKRFSEIATLIGKNDDSTIKVRTSGFLGGEEKEITYKEFKENSGDYAPLVNDRIKALRANEERLRKEQTEVIQNFKIPVIDKETGEQIFITLQEKMEYDEKRKQLQDQKDLERSRANQIDVRSQLQGVRN